MLIKFNETGEIEYLIYMACCVIGVIAEKLKEKRKKAETAETESTEINDYENVESNDLNDVNANYIENHLLTIILAWHKMAFECVFLAEESLKDAYYKIKETNPNAEIGNNIQTFLSKEKGFLTEAFRLKEFWINENCSFRDLAKAIEQHVSYFDYLQNKRGEKIFEIIDKMFNIMNICSGFTNETLDILAEKNSECARLNLEHSLIVELNSICRDLASTPEMERLWLGIRQYIFSAHVLAVYDNVMWMDYDAIYDETLYDWKCLFKACIKAGVAVEFCEKKINDPRFCNSYSDTNGPINLLFSEYLGSLIIVSIISGKTSNAVRELASLFQNFITELAKFDGIVTLDEEQKIERFIHKIDKIIEININKQKETVIEQGSLNTLNTLNSMIGLDSVKNEILSLKNFIIMQKKHSEQGIPVVPMSYHCVFTGNPGTGKTTVARIVAQIYNELGILKKGHLVECDRSSLVAGYIGQTAIKTNEVVDKALDGVLFIDEAYTLAKKDDSFGQEAIDTLLKRMEDDRERLVVIVAGYTDEMKMFIESNPGLKSRFSRYIEFEDYTEDELLTIFKKMAEQQKYELSEDAEKKLRDIFCSAKGDCSFGNARGVRNLFQKALINLANRIAKNGDFDTGSQILTAEDFAEEKSKKDKRIDPIVQLASMVGLRSVKQEVLSLKNIVMAQKKRAAAGLPLLSMSYHCVFTGNPGTGKTTVARIVAEIYKDLGVLKKGHLVECDRSALVAGYVGQTAIKTNAIIDKALDGVLFIDEAYTLAKKDDSFGQEAIDTLLKRMEDDRKRLVVIVAGYTNEMKKFIESNPGLKSRFNRYIEFDDYTEDELVQLFKNIAEKQKFVLAVGFESQLRLILKKIMQVNSLTFGNGRGIRNLFEKTVLKQANRLAMTNDGNLNMQVLIPQDLPKLNNQIVLTKGEK